MSLPSYEYDRLEALEELSTMPGYDASYVIVYYNQWSDYECSGWLAIFERGKQLYSCDGGYSPEVGDIEEKLIYEPISLEQAIADIESIEEACVEMAIKHGPVRPSP